jgi:ATP-dependent Lon protease
MRYNTRSRNKLPIPKKENNDELIENEIIEEDLIEEDLSDIDSTTDEDDYINVHDLVPDPDYDYDYDKDICIKKLEKCKNNKHLPNKIINKYSKEEKKYISGLKSTEINDIIYTEKIINDNTVNIIPLRFKIIKSNINLSTKRLIINKLEQFSQMNPESGEYFKLKYWLHNINQLPFDNYCHLPVSIKDPVEKIKSFMTDTKKILDTFVYGHEEPKQHILRILAQWIANPSSNGHCIGIHGPMGIGKTSLIKDGLAKALNIPFGFIALGGASDSSFLEGHSYTYEGSSYGKIAEILIKTKCNNPIIFFDELDKVSITKKGEDIIGILTHLTDMTQNTNFNDKYFSDIEINLSKCLFIFSYNDEKLLNPILKDRITTIKVNGYKNNEKIVIAKKYLLPNILKEFNIDSSSIIITDKIIEYIIELVDNEEGVRNLKRGLESIISWINMYKFLPNQEIPITCPFTITKKFVEKHIN